MRSFGLWLLLLVPLAASANGDVAEALLDDPDPTCKRSESTVGPMHPVPIDFSAIFKAYGLLTPIFGYAHVTATFICAIFTTGWTGLKDSFPEPRCHMLAGFLAGHITFAVGMLSQFSDTSSGTIGQPAHPPPPSRFDHLADSERLELPFTSDLQALGHTYESWEIEPAPLRNENEAEVHHSFGVRSPMLNNTVVDQHFVRHEGNRSGLALLTVRGPASGQTRRDQRVSRGPGLKLSWRIVKGTGPPKPLDRVAVQNLAWNIGEDWATRLQKAFQTGNNFTQYYGTLAMGSEFELAFVVSGLKELDRRFEDPLVCEVRD